MRTSNQLAPEAQLQLRFGPLLVPWPRARGPAATCSGQKRRVPARVLAGLPKVRDPCRVLPVYACHAPRHRREMGARWVLSEAVSVQKSGVWPVLAGE